MRFSMPLPDSLTAGRCCGDGLALSPDGRTLVFTMNGATGSLFRRSIDRLEAEPIPGTEGGSVPFFSPDGRWVGFAADGKLRKVSLAGGPPIPIATAEAVDEASWSEQDQIIFADNAGLLTVSASGGEPQRLLGPDSLQFVYAPTFLPGGQAALFVTRPRGSGLDAARIAVIDLKNRKVDTLGPGTQVRYANGYLVFGGADNTLLAQPFDPGRRKLTGQAVAILDRVTLHGGRTHEFALSQSGTLVYQPSAVAGTGEQIVLAGPSGKAPITLPGRVAGDLEDPTFSPDGHKILLRIATGSAGTGDLWLLDRQQGTLERFTVGGATWPAWSRDGRRVAYQGSDGGGGIYIKNADGTGEPRLILKGGNLAPGSWLPGDRGLVIFGAGRPQTRGDIGMIALGDTTPRWLLETEFRELHPQVSPDGRWLAFSSNRTGSFEVYVQPLDGNGPQVQVSTEGGQSPRWSPDGRTLYYAANQQTIMAAARAPGLGFAVASRKTVLEAGYMDFNNTNVNWDVSPDGKQFLYIEQAAGGSAHFTWVMNWPQLVKEMTGAQK